MKRTALLLAILSITLFAGCRTVAVIPVGTHATVTHTRHVLPPHAPAHGYRQRHNDYDLEYDTDFGAYVVLGYDGIYFSNNLYLRFSSGIWQTTSRLDGRWHDAEHRHIPDRLRGHKRYNRHNSHNRDHRRYSPPPRAPRHGHRHSHQHGVDLIFDSGIGAYIALGFDDLFFFDNHYMRFYDGYWHSADRHDGRWRRANDRHVPHKLRKARKRHNKNFSKKLKKQYRKEHREYRKTRNDRRHNGKRVKRKDHHDDRDDRKKRKKKGHDDDDDDYNDDRKDKRERRDNGWLR